MGHYVWADGAKVTDTQFQDITDQTIIHCTSTTRPADVYRIDGMVIFEVDTRKYFRCDGTGLAGTWVFMWDDAKLSVGGARTAWTPVVTQGATPAQSVAAAWWWRIAVGLYVLTARINFTGAGTSGSPITVSGLPMDTDNFYEHAVGKFDFFDSGAAAHDGVALLTTGDTLQFRLGGTNVSAPYFGSAFAIANNDALTFTVTVPGA